MTQRVLPNLFLMGMPRSGTKLLRTLLNNHTKIFIPEFETDFIPSVIAEFAGRELSERDVSRAVRKIKGSSFFYYYLKKYEFDFDRLMLRHRCTIYDILRAFFFELRGRAIENYAYVGDKSPRNMRSCVILANGFPDARFIHIVRDPRDYALSVKKAWGKNELRAILLWVKEITSFRNAIVADKKQFIEVRYEDLLADPEATLRKCTEFLGLDYELDMVHLSAPVEKVGDARGAVIKRDNAGKYFKNMSTAHIEKIDDYCVELLHLYGYPCSSERLYNKSISTVMDKVLQSLDAVSVLRLHIRKRGFRDGLVGIIRNSRY